MNGSSSPRRLTNSTYSRPPSAEHHRAGPPRCSRPHLVGGVGDVPRGDDGAARAGGRRGRPRRAPSAAREVQLPELQVDVLVGRARRRPARRRGSRSRGRAPARPAGRTRGRRRRVRSRRRRPAPAPGPPARRRSARSRSARPPAARSRSRWSRSGPTRCASTRVPRNQPLSRRYVVRGVSKWYAGSGTRQPGPYVASRNSSVFAGAGRCGPRACRCPSGKIHSRLERRADLAHQVEVPSGGSRRRRRARAPTPSASTTSTLNAPPL